MATKSNTESYRSSDGQTVYRSNVKVQSAPEVSVWDYVMSNISFDDRLAAFTICDAKGRELSYGEFKREAIRLGLGLRQKAGLKPNDVVLIFMGNNLRYPIVLFACLFAGLRISFANPNYTQLELRHILKVLRPAKIFTTGSLYRHLGAVGCRDPQIVLVDVAPMGFSIGHIDQFKASAEHVATARAHQPKDNKETIFLPWSSGTTGLPKAVEITHRNVVAMMIAIRALPGMYARGDRSLVALPFFHAIGLIGGIILSLCLHGQVFIHQPFHPVKYIDLISKHQITWTLAVPPMLKAIIDSPNAAPEKFKSLRFMASGAAPLDADLQAKASQKLGVPVIQGHGQTETTVAAFGLTLNMKHGTVGYIVPGVEARLVDDDEKDVKRGERGEIFLRGPNITKGYYKNDEANASTFTKDGWLKTGDVGVMDDENQLSIVDRKKELIKYKGYQVAPAELEALLLQHPSVAAAAVIGVYSDSEATELPRAYVQIRPSGGTSGQNLAPYIQQWVKGKVSNAKQLRGGVKIIDKVPMNPSGKILRKELRKLVEAERRQSQSKL